MKMTKLVVIEGEIFDVKNISDEDLQHSDTFLVPNDFLESPFLFRNSKDGIIYLQDSEYYPPENLYAP